MLKDIKALVDHREDVNDRSAEAGISGGLFELRSAKLFHKISK